MLLPHPTHEVVNNMINSMMCEVCLWISGVVAIVVGCRSDLFSH